MAGLLLNRTVPTSCIRDFNHTSLCSKTVFASEFNLNSLRVLFLMVVWTACVHRDNVLVAVVVGIGWCNGCMVFFGVLMSFGCAPQSSKNTFPFS